MMRKGYILIVTMLIIAASMVIVTSLVQRAQAYKKLSSASYAREKAKILALSGIDIACAQLAALGELKDEQKQMAELLMLTDRTQTFTLREDIDGIDGEIGITIASEQGKININALYDFKKHAFVGDTEQQPRAPQAQAQPMVPNEQAGSGVNGKKILQWICEKIQPQLKEKELFGRLERFLKARKTPLVDATELVEVMQFKKSASSVAEIRALFTTMTPDAQLQPLLLSPALCTVFGFKQFAQTKDARTKQIEEISKKLKTSINWPQEWNGVLGTIYGKDFQAVPVEIRPLLQSKFESQWLSVVSYGTYNSITQRLCVVLEKEVSTQKDALSLYRIRRLYWL